MFLDGLVFVWKRGALRRYLAVIRFHLSFSRPGFGRLTGYMAILCDEWDEGDEKSRIGDVTNDRL